MDTIFRVVLALVFLFFIAHRGYYTGRLSQSQKDTLDERKNNRSSVPAALLAMAGLISLLAYLVAPQRISWASLPLPAWARWTGVAAAGLGFGLLQWSQITLGKNWSDTPRITVQQQLVTAGPYRWIRHPIYTAFLLILGSSLLIAANWFVGGAWIGMTALDIHGRIRYEEEKMLSRFGEAYQEYRQQTGSLLPRIPRAAGQAE